MKKTNSFTTLLLLFVFILGMSSTAFSENQSFTYSDGWGKAGLSILSTKSSGIEISYSMEKFSLIDTEIKGEQLQNILLPEVLLFNDAGMPDLPGLSKLIAIPEGAKASLKIVEFETELIENVNMAPAPIIPKEDDPVMIYEKTKRSFPKILFTPKILSLFLRKEKLEV